MDKRESSAFAQVCRQFVQRGGTIVGLAHTNKNLTAAGELRFAGTTDFLEDFDSAYLLTPAKSLTGDGECVVEFKALKRRGNNASLAAYAYTGEDVSYQQKLASVHPVDADALDTFKRAATLADDATIIDGIFRRIDAGEGEGQMQLAKAAAVQVGASHRQVLSVLERYTGEDAARHKWRFRKGERGVRKFERLVPMD